MITCVKKISVTVVRVLSFLVNSFEKLFLSQDTFFKITILIFSLVLSNLFFEVQSSYALKPTPTLSVSLLSASNIELHSSDILSKPNHVISIPNYYNVKTNNVTGATTYIDVEKTAFTDINDSSNTASINMISNERVIEHLADIGENTFAGSIDCRKESPDEEPEGWDPLDLVSSSIHNTHSFQLDRLNFLPLRDVTLLKSCLYYNDTVESFHEPKEVDLPFYKCLLRFADEFEDSLLDI